MRGRWMDVHGAGAQRSDPKTGDIQFPRGHGPQGDARRVDCTPMRLKLANRKVMVYKSPQGERRRRGHPRFLAKGYETTTNRDPFYKPARPCGIRPSQRKGILSDPSSFLLFASQASPSPPSPETGKVRSSSGRLPLVPLQKLHCPLSDLPTIHSGRL